MKHARPLLLAASTVALFISACSTPADIQTPDLAPQFGTVEDDIGVDVAVSSSDRIYALSDQVVDRCDDSEPQRVLLSRYDSRGDLAWNRQVAFQNYDYDCTNLKARILQADTQGNSYALVALVGTTGDVMNYAHYDLYKHDAAGKLVRKIDIGSNFWSFDEADAPHENAIDMAVDGGGNIYLAFEKGDYDVDGDRFSTSNVVTKYSMTGTLQWQRTSTVGTPKGITVSSSGSVYVVGSAGLARYTNSGGLTWTKPGTFEEVIVSGSNLYTRYRKDVRKYDGTGKQLWLRSQTGLSTIVFQDMTGDTSGNVYLSGKYDSGGGNFNAMTRKLNSSGSVLFTKTYGTPAYDDARGIATISGGEVYITGETQGSLAHTNIGGRDGYLRKLSSSGNPVWTR